MKKSQWIPAAAILTVLISVVTYAMSYLGSGGKPVVDPTISVTREIVFPDKAYSPFGVLEREERTRGFVDYWFYNPNEEAVQVGLHRKNCQCGTVEIFTLPEERRPWIARSAAAINGVRPLGPLHSLSLCCLALHQMQEGITGHELLEKTEKTPIAPAAIGWARLGWSERKGKQSLAAELWFDNPSTGKTGTLNVALYFHEPLRVVGILRINPSRPLNDDDLRRGVRESILVWSSTRSSLRIEATSPPTWGSAQSDPFVVGQPELLSPAETFALAKANNEGSAAMPEATRGSVQCAYRIPITLLAKAPDGTPFDIGPFRRTVTISSPDVTGDSKTVLVMGRVEGVIAISNPEERGGVNFRTFLRSRGRAESITLESRIPGVELTFDRKRTATFLDAVLEPDKLAPVGLQVWNMRARVLPDKVDGEFPRANDPLYEDSAIYLNVRSPGKPLRSIRVPALGNATGR